MRDTIYTIPIQDVFSPKTGCPVCRLREMLEKRCVDYIMGAAMMEPDIRMETNKYGFCPAHLDMLAKQKNRLSLALMLETHLDELREKHLPAKKGTPPVSETCFICREIDRNADKLLDTALKLCQTDESFRELFFAQEYYCFAHYESICRKASASMRGKQAAAFTGRLSEKMDGYIRALREEVHAFTVSFDYRNAGAANRDETIRASVDKAIGFLK